MSTPVGFQYTHAFHITQQQVNAFAELTGDSNPLHLDETFAAQTPFKKPIIHGFLSGSVFSKVFGMEFPGPGSVYLAQSMEFLRPMYPGQDYTAVFTVKEVDERKHTAIIATEIKDAATGKLTLRGEAKVMNPEKF